MVRTKQQRRRNRRIIDTASPPLTPNAHVVSVTASAGSQVTIVFDGPVMISAGSYPTTWKFSTANRTITSIVSTDGVTYVFGMSGAVVAGEAYTMPGSDPAARTPLGGYVATSTGHLA